jgi:hypothetical protein
MLILSCDAVKCMAFGQDLEGPPELRDALKCEIRLTTNNVAVGSSILVSLTLSNTSSTDVQMPCPGTLEPGLRVNLFLLTADATGGVQRLSVPAFVFQGKLTAEQSKLLEGPADHWDYIYVPARWTAVPAHGSEQFQVFAEISPNVAKARTSATGNYGLQFEIQYVMKSNKSSAYIRTNQWTSAERIAEAKASSVFLVDMQKLWTGRIQSNIAQITLIGSGQ